MKKNNFTPHEYECPTCHDKIHSTYSGEYVSCQCGSSAVDETEWYCRLIGDKMPMFIGEYKNE